MTALLTALLLLLGVALFFVVLGFIGSRYIMFDPARLRHTVWPEHFGLAYEKVSFRNSDGQTLRGWILPASRPSGRTILLCHGWGANKGHILDETKFLRDRGFDLFYFDFRGCGESEGRVGTIGYLEARDFDAALTWLRASRPSLAERLGVFGQSMGGSVALVGAARHKLFKAAVIESCYASYNLVLPTYSKAKWGLPPSPLFPSIRFWLNLHFGDDLERMSPAYFMDRLDGMPVMYLWGTEDRVMPLNWGRDLYARTPGPKELRVFERGWHGRLWEADPVAYEDSVGTFFERYL